MSSGLGRALLNSFAPEPLQQSIGSVDDHQLNTNEAIYHTSHTRKEENTFSSYRTHSMEENNIIN
jgi:hypothetical protein